jgi:hypothetical protein
VLKDSVNTTATRAIGAAAPGTIPCVSYDMWPGKNPQETYEAVISVAKEHGGGYGLGIDYAKTMLGEHASEAGAAKK